MVKTKDIVTEFMRTKLKQRGFTCAIKEIKRNNKDKKANNESNELYNINQHLDKISNVFLDFTKQTRNDDFQRMTHSLLEAFEYRSLEILADELFSEGILWSHIVSILVFGVECACKALESDQYNAKEKEEMVSKLTDWMSKYITENLEDWISLNDEGWLSVTKYEVKVPESYKGIRQYFGLAAVAVFISGLYLCSKF